MRRITIWMTICLSVAVLGFAIWLNTSGQTAKPGEEGGHQEPAVTSSPG